MDDNEFIEEQRVPSSRFADLEHQIEVLESRIIGIENYVYQTNPESLKDPRD